MPVNRLHALLFASVALAFSALAQAPAAPPSKAAPSPDALMTSSPYEKPAREFIMNFNRGRFDEAVKSFDDKMKITVTPGTLKSMKEQADREVGAFRSIVEVNQDLHAGAATMEFITRYEKADVSFKVLFDRYGKIGAVYFTPIVDEKVDPALDRMAREFLAAVNSGRFDAAGKHFDTHMKDDLPPAKLAELATQLQKTFGRFHSITGVHQTTEIARKTIDLTAAYEKEPVKITVVFDRNKPLIIGVYIAPASASAASR